MRLHLQRVLSITAISSIVEAVAIRHVYWLDDSVLSAFLVFTEQPRALSTCISNNAGLVVGFSSHLRSFYVNRTERKAPPKTLHHLPKSQLLSRHYLNVPSFQGLFFISRQGRNKTVAYVQHIFHKRHEYRGGSIK